MTINDKIVRAVIRLHRRKDEIAALKSTLEPCEPVASWRNSDRSSAKPEFCAKAYPLTHIVFEDYYEYPQTMTDPAQIAKHIAELWCPACQRNSPKVVEIRRLKRGVASFAGAVTRLVRAAIKGDGDNR